MSSILTTCINGDVVSLSCSSIIRLNGLKPVEGLQAVLFKDKAPNGKFSSAF